MTTKARKILIENGLIATHWGHIIDKAANSTEGFTLKNMNDAADWVTCACGKLVEEGIEKDSDGTPMDAELTFLGYEFNENVCNNDSPEEAAKTLVAIQHRAAILIKEYHENSK